MFQIDIDLVNEPQQLTPAVLQVAEMLGIYRAELARVLHLNCGDIGKFTSMRKTLLPGTDAWTRATHFIHFFNKLNQPKNGDSVAMCHWLRSNNDKLQSTPLLCMVDRDELERVIQAL